MSNTEKLKNFLTQEVIPDLEEAIDEVFTFIEKAKEASIADREELEDLREMRDECKDIVTEIDAGDMTDEEAADLLAEFVDMKTANDE
jgi:DNA-binding transcriptional regulator YhcF (GntR family)